MAFDPTRGRVVLFGGYDRVIRLGGTWELDGNGWSQAQPLGSPSARADHAMTWDAARRRILLVGGRDVNRMPIADTWEYGLPPCGNLGPGHPGAGLPISCTTPPRLGTNFGLSFSDPPPIGVGYNLLLVSPAPCFLPPLVLNPPGVCNQAFVYVLPVVLLVAGGDPAVFQIPLPAVPALAGAQFCLQGAALETGVCFRVTDGLLVTIQP
jgi:hypothetical protein